jgi:hypothetical protein
LAVCRSRCAHRSGSDATETQKLRNIYALDRSNPLSSWLNYPDLRHQDPALFGFFFTALLSHGNSVWTQGEFTREDRIAFFSAQSYLLPLPKSLGETLDMPLLSKPGLTKQATLKALETQTSSPRCRRRLTAAWQVVSTKTTTRAWPATDR